MSSEVDANALAIVIILAVVWWKIWDALNEVQSSDPGKRQALMYNQLGEQLRGGDGGRVPSSGDASPVSRELLCQLDVIHSADASFDAESFLGCGRLVYETVVMAFANGDRELLQVLLSRDVYETFAQAIKTREDKREKVDLSFIGFKKVAIVNADMFDKRAEIAIDFVCQLVMVTRNAGGAVVAGDPQKVVEVNDRWTFARELSSPSPVWKLVATGFR